MFVPPITSCTTFAPSYKKLVVVPPTVFDVRRPKASYDLSGKVINEIDGNNVTLANYTYFNGSLLAEYKNATTYFVHKDHLGSTRLVTATDKSIFDSMDFYPFGEQALGDTGTTHKFTGKERDSESGNDYFEARHYTSSIGRWLSPDRLNVTDDRIMNPSNTLNKYVYGANNPFRFVDPDGRDIVALYEPPHGVRPGHFMLLANNPQTGESAMMSFGPRDTSTSGEAITAIGGVQESTKDYKLPTSADDLRQNFAALSIQTTPEQAQEVLNFIKNFDPSNANYKLFSQNCSTICRDALKAVGLLPSNTRSWSPASLWDNVFGRYARTNGFNNWLFNNGYTPHRRGTDYGNPRFGMDTFEFLWLQLKPRRACTTIQGPKGPETHCVD